MYLILTSTEYLATKACDISVQRTKICFQLSLCAMQNDFKMENDPSCKCQSSEPCHLEREILPVHYLVSNFRHFAIVGKTSFLSPKGKKYVTGKMHFRNVNIAEICRVLHYFFKVRSFNRSISEKLFRKEYSHMFA